MAKNTLVDVSFTIEGIAPLLMHCGRTADPTNPFTIAIGKLTSKRKKTLEEIQAISELEWWAALYYDDESKISISKDGVAKNTGGAKLQIPAHILDSLIRDGARKFKLGKAASAGVFVNGDGKFMVRKKEVKPEKIFGDQNYTSRFPVKVGAAKVIRTRPIFPENWSISFDVTVDTEVMEIDAVRDSLEIAGKIIGVGDWRPGAPRGGSFGRFIVK